MSANQPLTERLMKLSALLHRYETRIRGERGNPYGSPHRGQGRVLTLLRMQPEISQKELAYLLDMRGQSLGELLTRLEKSGLITRSLSQEDRRAQIIRLTKEGENAASRVRAASEEVDLFQSFSQQEQNTMRGYMDKLIDELEGRLAHLQSPPHYKGERHHDGRHAPSHGKKGERPTFGPDEDPRFYREFLWEDEDIEKP